MKIDAHIEIRGWYLSERCRGGRGPASRRRRLVGRPGAPDGRRIAADRLGTPLRAFPGTAGGTGARARARAEEVGSAGGPARPVKRDATAGHDHVDVRMVAPTPKIP